MATKRLQASPLKNEMIASSQGNYDNAGQEYRLPLMPTAEREREMERLREESGGHSPQKLCILNTIGMSQLQS